MLSFGGDGSECETTVLWLSKIKFRELAKYFFKLVFTHGGSSPTGSHRMSIEEIDKRINRYRTELCSLSWQLD